MGIRKYGTGEVLPPEPEDEGMSKEASTDDPWTEEDQRELVEESER